MKQINHTFNINFIEFMYSQEPMKTKEIRIPMSCTTKQCHYCNHLMNLLINGRFNKLAGPKGISILE